MQRQSKNQKKQGKTNEELRRKEVLLVKAEYLHLKEISLMVLTLFVLVATGVSSKVVREF